MQDWAQSYRIPCFAMPKGKLALISQWTGQSGKEYKKKLLLLKQQKVLAAEVMQTWNFPMVQEKKILNNNQVCNKTGS